MNGLLLWIINQYGDCFSLNHNGHILLKSLVNEEAHDRLSTSVEIVAVTCNTLIHV